MKTLTGHIDKFMCHKTILVLSLTLSITGCNTTDNAALRTAAVTTAIAKAPTNLPKQPAYCRKEMPLIMPKLGDKWRHSQSMWMNERTAINKQIVWCADNADKSVKYAAGVTK